MLSLNATLRQAVRTASRASGTPAQASFSAARRFFSEERYPVRLEQDTIPRPSVEELKNMSRGELADRDRAARTAKRKYANALRQAYLDRIPIKPEGWRFGFTPEEVEGQPEPVRTVLSLRNGSQMEVNQFRKRQAIEYWKTRDGDTGSTQVQIAVLTERIDYITHHLRQHRQDKHSRKGMIDLVGKRDRLLKYLKRKDPQMYIRVVDELALRGV